MANYFNLTLDTTGVSNSSILIENGATYTSNPLVNLTISTSDASTVGYQMKIWGDVDTSFDTNVKSTEGTSAWITYATTKQIKLTAGDGTKTIFLKLRDDVWNEGAIVNDSIIVDATIPVVSISGADVPKISKITGKHIATFSFTSSEDFVEYKVKVVPNINSTNDVGNQIGITNGSTNMSGTGTWTTSNSISCQITGADLELASAGDGSKIIKVFVKDASGQWSV